MKTICRHIYLVINGMLLFIALHVTSLVRLLQEQAYMMLEMKLSGYGIETYHAHLRIKRINAYVTVTAHHTEYRANASKTVCIVDLRILNKETTMFGKAISGALGISDIGQVVEPKDYDKVEADDYVIHENHERIIFLIKSKKDEYCFTNKAFIHVDGTTVVSKKRLIRRFDYARYPVSDVYLETAGTMDLDIEIKFSMGECDYSIDVGKKFIKQLKALYKSLILIEKIQTENKEFKKYAKLSIDVASKAMRTGMLSSEWSPSEQFRLINEYTNRWFMDNHYDFHRVDFGEVFDMLIKG